MSGRIIAAQLLLLAPLPAQSVAPELMQPCTARSIGPAVPGGRIVDVAAHAGRPWEILAASASGGLWKSVNNGTTWSCVFERALSLGDVAVAESDPDVIWLGTGEGNNQRSSYAGNGVWRSLDGGATWSHLGLEETQHIGRVVVDPEDADVAWVAALGHLYTPNDERGLFKTTDGGASWERVLFLGESIGIADVVLDPEHPGTVYAASYERRRRAWNFSDSGDSAIYKSIDGGASWRRLSGGLPSGKLGRIGLTLFPSDPDRLYACIDRQGDPGEGPNGETNGEVNGGEVWRTLDGGASWEKRNEKSVHGEPAYYYGQIQVDPHDPEHVWLLGVPMFVSKDGGKTFTEGETARSLHSDHHALWFDPRREGRILLGNDGGLAQSYDGGARWDWFENLPVTQFYTVSVDTRRPYSIFGGLQDNGVWMGPSRSRSRGGASNGEWRFIGGGDGMYVLADPDDPDTIYLESQFGALQRTNLVTADSKWIQPPHEGDEKDPRDRYNWCSPLLVSAHNSRVLYFGAHRLWKSLDRGDHWKAVSGDLTTHDPAKLKGNVPHCTLTTISESPLDPDLLLVGSDDGNVQWSDDGGRNWTNLAGRFPGLPSHRWCSRVELSRHDAATAWVAFSGYREDEFTPWVFRTRDGGRSFERVTEGLPEGPVNVLHESPRRANVIFLGGDGGAFFSLDGGDGWQPLASGLPTVSVLDLAVHPREREVVLGTHGRGFYVIDVTPHEQLDAELLAADAHLLAPSPATMWRQLHGLGHGWNGDRDFTGPNPPAGAPLWYWLGSDGEEKPELVIVDAKGKVVRTLEAEPGRGLHRVLWDFRFDPPPEEEAKPDADPKAAPQKRRPLEDDAIGEPGDEVERERERELEREHEEEEEADFSQDASRRGRGGRGRRGGREGELATPGSWTVRLRAGGRTFEQELRLLADPDYPIRGAAGGD